jgi:hypothetical protein
MKLQSLNEPSPTITAHLKMQACTIIAHLKMEMACALCNAINIFLFVKETQHQ